MKIRGSASFVNLCKDFNFHLWMRNYSKHLTCKMTTKPLYKQFVEWASSKGKCDATHMWSIPLSLIFSRENECFSSCYSPFPVRNTRKHFAYYVCAQMNRLYLYIFFPQWERWTTNISWRCAPANAVNHQWAMHVVEEADRFRARTSC